MSEVLAEDEIQQLEAKKSRYLWILLAYFAFTGCLPEVSSEMELALSLPALVLGVAWCFADAAQRNIRLGLPFRILLIGLFIVGFPIYLFRSRGWGGFKALLVAILFIALLLGTEFGTTLIGAWFRGEEVEFSF